MNRPQCDSAAERARATWECFHAAKPVEWTGQHVLARRSAVFDLSDSQQDALRGAGTALPDEGVTGSGERSRSDMLQSFPADLIAEWNRELECGSGVVLLRGFPLDLPDTASLKRAYWRLGRCLGMPVSQTNAGNAIAEVTDLGKSATEPTARGHQTNAPLPFHCDRCDVIGLLCVRRAERGGRSLMVSAPAVFRTILERAPERAVRLLSPLPQDRRGEELPGEASWISLPIFSFIDGRFVSRYIRRFIDSAGRFGPDAQLSDEATADLDYLDAILSEPGRALELDLEPDDLLLINNYTVWHARTAYVDGTAPLQPRLLLRLWLATPVSRALPNAYMPLYGSVTAGALRGGVPPATLGAFPR